MSSSNSVCFLIVFNVAKKHNIGTLVRCATAFNVKAVCLVGSRQYNTFGSHGSDVYVSYMHFPTLEDCCDHLKTTYSCEIVGIEITDAAVAVQSMAWSGPAAFMLGNEGQGLNERQMRLCDRFVYIPQYGVGTASLNVAVAASIVLHRFAVWAGYPENERHNQKFNVGERPERTWARGTVPLSAEEIEAIRQRRIEGIAAIEEESIGFDFSEAGINPL